MNLKQLSIALLRTVPNSLNQPALNPALTLVADPEVASAWGGGSALHSSGSAGHVWAAGVVLATVTVPEDGFYVINAVGMVAPAAGSLKTVEFRIRNGTTILWALRRAFISISAIGVVGDVDYPTIRCWLEKGWIVEVRVVEASAASENSAASLAMRQLYQ